MLRKLTVPDWNWTGDGPLTGAVFGLAGTALNASVMKSSCSSVIITGIGLDFWVKIGLVVGALGSGFVYLSFDICMTGPRRGLKAGSVGA